MECLYLIQIGNILSSLFCAFIMGTLKHFHTKSNITILWSSKCYQLKGFIYLFCITLSNSGILHWKDIFSFQKT